MNIIINSSVRRITNTVYDCIDSIGNIPIDIITATHIILNPPSNVTIHKIDYGIWNIRRKMSFSYIAALNLIPDGGLIVEDDCLLDADWRIKLNNKISSIKEDKYIISLWSDLNGRIGSVGIYYSKSIVEEFKEYLKRFSRSNTAADILLFGFLHQTKYPCHTENMARHIGGLNSTRWL